MTQKKNRNREILHLAIPNVISNITVPLLSSVDAALMGRLGDPVYLGAVALGSVLFNFIYWSLGFLRMGTTGLTAQAYGKKDQKEMILVFAQAMLVAWACGIAILFLQWPIKTFGFYFIEGSNAVELEAIRYFDVRIWAAPFTISLYVLNGWFLGMQNAKYPMVVTVLVNIVNIILNVVFVYSFHMTTTGVALATVIAQILGFGTALWLFFKKYRTYWDQFQLIFLKQKGKFAHFFSVNKDIFIRTICLLITFSFFTARSAESGDLLLSANTILLQYLFIMSYGIDGFAFAAESLTGKYVGSGERLGLKESISYCFYWGIGISIGFSSLYWFFGSWMLSLFSTNLEVINAAQIYLPWLVLLPVISAIAFIWDGVYIGATASKPMRNSMMISTFLVFLPVFYFFENSLNNHALWLAMVLFMVARSILLSVLAKKHIFGLGKI